MKTVTSGYKTALNTPGRELDTLISYYSSDGGYLLTTESGDYLTTEAGDYLETEKGWYEISQDYIFSARPQFNTNLFKSTMKYIEIDSKVNILKGLWLNLKLGVKVGATYEYADYSKYYVFDNPIYQSDTKSYKILAYDKMIESMILYDDNPLTITYPITVKNLLIAICEKLGWDYDLTTFVNDDVSIASDLYSNNNLTYRDILDDLSSVVAGNIMFNVEDKLFIKYPTETGETITDDQIKNTNSDIGKKYGKINSLVLSRSIDSDTIYRRDETSILENGLTELKIKDNKILSSVDRENFIDEIFNQINGLEYYIYDIDTTGLVIFDPLDRFTINTDGIDYTTIMLNNDTIIESGLVEKAYVEEPEETKTDYTTSKPTDKDVKNAVIIANKNNAEVVLKVNDDGKIAQVTLGANANTGSEITIEADQINLTATDIINLLAGNTINLTSNEIVIASTNFNVDKDGNATMASATLTDGLLKIGTKEIFNTNGVLTLLTFPAATGDTPLGWWYDGTNVINEAINIAYTIPNNFVLVNAYVSVYHIPCYTNTSGGYKWGYSRAVKLYSLNNTGLYFQKEFGTIQLPQYGEISSSEVYTNGTSTNAFGSSGWTASVADGTTHNAEFTNSSNISTRLSSNSSGMLIIKSSSTRPTTDVQVAEQTGQGFATLNIIGYYKI